jgi:hypothetical protein
VLKLQLPADTLAARKVIVEVQQVVDPATTAARAVAQQRLQDTPSGEEVQRLRTTWASLQPAGMQDPAVAVAAAAGMEPAELRSVMEGWEAAGETANTFFEDVLKQLGSREGWDLGWDGPRFFRKDVQLEGRKVAAGHISYGFVLRDKAALQPLIDPQTGRLQLPDSQQQFTIRYDGLPVRVFSLSGVQGVDPQHWAKAVEAAGIPVLAAAWAVESQQQPCRDAVKLVLAVTGSVPTAMELPTPDGVGSFFLQLRETADPINLSAAHRKVPCTGMAREWVLGRSQQQLEEQREQQRQQREQQQREQQQQERERQQQAAELAAQRKQQRQQQRERQQQRQQQETSAAAASSDSQAASTASGRQKQSPPE